MNSAQARSSTRGHSRNLKKPRRPPSVRPSPKDQEVVQDFRERIEGVFDRLYDIEDVLIVCTAASESSPAELHRELRSVLRRHATNPLFGQLKALTKIVRDMGGKTCMSDDIDLEDDE